MLDPIGVFLVFLGVWILLIVASFAFSTFSRNAALKRKLFRPFAVVVGVLFLGFVYLMGMGIQAVAIAAPVVLLITVLNFRAVKFCDACGRTVQSQNPLSPAKYCPRCGADIVA